MIAASTARPTAVPAIVQRRPCCRRSRAGPMIGATIANGAIVTSRYSRMLPRWAVVEAPKKTVVASATVIMASVPLAMTWFQIIAVRPDSSAPSDLLALITLRVTLRATSLLRVMTARVTVFLGGVAGHYAVGSVPGGQCTWW